MRFKIGDEVRVKWADHWEITGHEMTLDEIKKECSKPKIGKARGVVVLNNRQVVVLASNHWEEDKTYDGSIFIIVKKNILEAEFFE